MRVEKLGGGGVKVGVINIPEMGILDFKAFCSAGELVVLQSRDELLELRAFLWRKGLWAYRGSGLIKLLALWIGDTCSYRAAAWVAADFGGEDAVPVGLILPDYKVGAIGG